MLLFQLQVVHLLPGTGSTGDGYRMAKQIGHTIEDLFPALVPLECEEDWVKDFQGLSLRNVNLKVLVDGDVKKRNVW